jgi:hypothetical protein
VLALALIEKAHELLSAVESDPKLAARAREFVMRLRSFIGAKSPDEWIPTKLAAAALGFRNERPLLDAGRRGELSIRGPRGKRLVRRGDLDTWIESRGLDAKKKVAPVVAAKKSPLHEPSFRAGYLGRAPGVPLPEPVAERMRALVTKYGLDAVAHEHQLTAARMGELLGIVEAPPQTLRAVR